MCGGLQPLAKIFGTEVVASPVAIIDALAGTGHVTREREAGRGSQSCRGDHVQKDQAPLKELENVRGAPFHQSLLGQFCHARAGWREFAW